MGIRLKELLDKVEVGKATVRQNGPCVKDEPPPYSCDVIEALKDINGNDMNVVIGACMDKDTAEYLCALWNSAPVLIRLFEICKSVNYGEVETTVFEDDQRFDEICSLLYKTKED